MVLQCIRGLYRKTWSPNDYKHRSRQSIHPDDFVYRVINNGIKLSMDGQGRAKDNIYIERFWMTIKYEHIYIRPSQDAEQLRKGIGWYIDWYNAQRRHTELNNNTPNTVFNSYLEPVKSAA
ncbi:MAG: transposase [Saprospiraceae bacterium]